MVHVQCPRAQAFAAGIAAADLRVVGPCERDHGGAACRRAREDDARRAGERVLAGRERIRGRTEAIVARVEAGLRRVVLGVVDVADAHRDGLASLQRAAVPVFAVPVEDVEEVRARSEALRELLPRDRHGEIDALDRRGNGVGAEPDLQEVLGLRRAVAPIVQAVGRAGDPQRLAEPLGLTRDDRAFLLAGVLGRTVGVGTRVGTGTGVRNGIWVGIRIRARALARAVPAARGIGIVRWAVRPVQVERRKVRDQHAPELSPRRIERGEALALDVGDGERGERRRAVDQPVAVEIEVGLAAGDRDDRDDLPVVRGDPRPADAI